MQNSRLFWGVLILLLGLWVSLPADAEETPATEVSPTPLQLYLFTYDYPPTRFMNTPTPADQKTLFYQQLDRALKQHGQLALTPDVEKADYRVTLQCASVAGCKQLLVGVQTPGRVQVVHYKIPAHPGDSAMVANRLRVTLEKRIAAARRGDVGVFGRIWPRSGVGPD